MWGSRGGGRGRGGGKRGRGTRDRGNITPATHVELELLGGEVRGCCPGGGGRAWIAPRRTLFPPILISKKGDAIHRGLSTGIYAPLQIFLFINSQTHAKNQSLHVMYINITLLRHSFWQLTSGLGRGVSNVLFPTVKNYLGLPVLALHRSALLKTLRSSGGSMQCHKLHDTLLYPRVLPNCLKYPINYVPQTFLKISFL